ncbi:Dabb family protein [Rhodococcus opacus]|uniref:Dabb family protein n=1 Tax=Rhodococcus opacus TaxID=37919 RepID=UPI001E392ADC|nr:Dabb family protein [Rhodococcus opacus]
MTKLVHLAADADVTAGAALAGRLHEVAAPSARRVLVEPALPGGINGGDVIAHLHFDDESHWRAVEPDITAPLCAPEIRHIDSVGYTGAPTPGPGRFEPTAYRTLFVSVDDSVDPAVVERFESETRTMPTHVWEQEYANLDGLLGPYMTHPYHWAHIDRWFDPERGPRIVTRLCHSFCAIDGPTITVAAPATPR